MADQRPINKEAVQLGGLMYNFHIRKVARLDAVTPECAKPRS